MIAVLPWECLLPFGPKSAVFLSPMRSIKINVHIDIILPVVLYRRETSSLILREDRRLRVFENGVLRKMFGREWNEVTGDWRGQHNE